ncbi:DUF2076 domain-containing protein [Peristeroidobacter soli]|jgi:hypothetical protein|uniref:DUF2076 domain-containing protein n=1 Tax=Peristeroidobacter soli TaxID=2497877 RepID=UPI00101D6DA0|nr:DUF2076 domain-containing protein [Peristeroidobacter soli]
MANQDQQIIQGLFTRLGEVERQAPPRDAAAEALIQQRIAEQPAAPYFMAQTIVMQEQALQHAQAKIEDLERQAQERPASGGLFGGLFGGGRQPARTNARPAAPMQTGQSGGFLAGAAQTAMGVAGGVLLGNAIGGMFAGDAKASEAAPSEPADEPAPEEESGFDDSFGGDEF